MKIQFLGAAGTVTGSKYLVTTARARVLLDCGLYQGFKHLRLRNRAPLPFAPASLDSVVLTHAHLDHSGYLPALARDGFEGRIHCTPATAELAAILLRDSAYLQEEQAEHANRHGYSRHHPALPLYTRADAERAIGLLWPNAFGREFMPGPGVVASFHPAGHILGAASVLLAGDGAKLAFSGDLGRADDVVMWPPHPLPQADAVVLESTYGDRLHDPADPAAEIARIVNTTAGRGGSVVVPCFAVGRAQAVLVLLHRLKQSGAIPATVPVFLDSPMAIAVTAVYRRHRQEHRLSHEECAALAEVARFVRTPEESRRLDESPWPSVILAGSGMAAGGRVLHHLKRFAPDPRASILLTGFQAPGTRGAALAQGAAEVKIHGGWVPVRAEVHALDRLSAHADRGGLLAWLAAFGQPAPRVFLTHGEPAAADALRVHIAERLSIEATVPEYRDEFPIEPGGPRQPRGREAALAGAAAAAPAEPGRR